MEKLCRVALESLDVGRQVRRERQRKNAWRLDGFFDCSSFVGAVGIWRGRAGGLMTLRKVAP